MESYCGMLELKQIKIEPLFDEIKYELKEKFYDNLRIVKQEDQSIFLAVERSLKSEEDLELGEEIKAEKPVACEFIAENISRTNSRLQSCKRSSVVAKSHKCPLCFQIFKQKTQMVHHFRTHTEEKPYGCGFCPKRFLTKSSLTCHIHYHLGENKEIFKCELCPKQYSRKPLIRFHILQHIGETLQHKCKICFKAFLFDCTLQIHQASHTNEKPFKCVECRKQFKHSGSLITHVRFLHSLSPILKHKCGICSKEFVRKGDLTRHGAVHNRKSHTCPFCTNDFSARHVLRDHILIKHPSSLKSPQLSSKLNLEKQLLVCLICSTKFGNKSRLRTHILHHLRHRCDDDNFGGSHKKRKFSERISMKRHMLACHLKIKQENTEVAV